MRKTVQFISYLSLIFLISAPALFYADIISLEMNKVLMTAATCLWFTSALCWMGRRIDTD